MSTKNIVLIILSGLVALAAIGFVIFSAVFTNNIAPSGALTAIPVLVSTAAPATATSQSLAPAASSATAIASATAVNTQAATVSASSTAAATADTANSGLAVFQIVPAQSQVNFSIYEELAGKANTVVGTTNQVAGQLALDAQDLSQTKMGVIQVDARGLTTDNDRRNGAIRNFILNTNQYEYITFTPKTVSGLTGAAQVGQTVTFQITGDLTIRNVTRPVTFDVTAQGATTTQITGSAKATVNRSDFGLSIPSVPNVANVGEQVTLQINFVASAQS